MDGDVDYMVAGHGQPVYPVVEGKGEIPDIAVYESAIKLKPFCVCGACEIVEVFYDRVVYKEHVLIPLKRGIEGVGIDDDTKKNNAGYVKP